MPSCSASNAKTALVHDVIEESPGSLNDPNHVLIVMDGLKEIQVELLEWVLKNFNFGTCCTITILGVMPWLNIPLSSKTWSDIWSMDLEDLSSVKDKCELKNDQKHQKLQKLIDICHKYGVKPEIKTEMGHPIKLLVVEEISSLHATLVVFDRHHDRKNIEYYAEKVPCNMVVVQDDGEVDMIKKRSVDNESESMLALDSPASMAPPCSRSIISEKLKRCLTPKVRGH